MRTRREPSLRAKRWAESAAHRRRVRNIGELLKLEPAERAKLLADFDSRECAELFYDWSFWARSDQRPPDGDWICWLILAGRGAGKTRAGAEAVRKWAQELRLRQPDWPHSR